MCRSIKVLRKAGQPPATADEIHAAVRQFVRKVTGSREPSRANAAAYEGAIARIAALTGDLLETMQQNGRKPRSPS